MLLASAQPILAQSIAPACENYETPQQQLICQEKLYQRYGVTLLDSSVPESCATSSSELTGSNNEQKAFNHLVTVGKFTKEQAAGIVGNMTVESTGVHPQILQGNTPDIITTAEQALEAEKEAQKTGDLIGWGVVQWTPPSKFINDPSIGLEKANDLTVQLNFVVEQLRGGTGIPEKAAGDDILKQTTVAGAAKSFMIKYERPAVQSESAQNARARIAEGVFQRYSNGVTGVTGSEQGGSEICVGAAPGNVIDGFVLYNQSDPKWADKPYGTSTIAEAGCGPSSVAMVVATLTGDQSVTPETIATKYSQYYKTNEGSSWDLMSNVPGDYGLTSRVIGKDMDAAKEAIRAGGLVIATGTGNKPFTSGGHILVIRGVTGEGKLLLGDSGHKDTSDVEYDESELIGPIRNMWVITK